MVGGFVVVERIETKTIGGWGGGGGIADISYRYCRLTKHSLLLPKLANLSAEWKVGWFCDLQKFVRFELFVFLKHH